jgi:hypothetical protein
MEGMSSSGGLEIGISCFTGPHFGTGGQKHTHTCSECFSFGKTECHRWLRTWCKEVNGPLTQIRLWFLSEWESDHYFFNWMGTDCLDWTINHAISDQSHTRLALIQMLAPCTTIYLWWTLEFDWNENDSSNSESCCESCIPAGKARKQTSWAFLREQNVFPPQQNSTGSKL